MSAILEMLPTEKLKLAGQSPWLDYISRDLLQSGSLKQLIESQGILGVTSNPSIFQNAISQSKGGYDKDIRKYAQAGHSTLEIYDKLSIQDIRDACDLFQNVYETTGGEHGFVSLEVLPNLAYDANKTITEALRLSKLVDRANLMIKVPATPEGCQAIEVLTAHGVSINATLIFSMQHYLDVANAYIHGLAARAKSKKSLSEIRSVASVFVSRFDTYLDKELTRYAEQASAIQKNEMLLLLGKAAIANSKLIYQEFKKLFSTPEFLNLQSAGAQIQKVLWGSTSCKNPKYPDLLYVETLVGRETVNTMPQVTVDALLDHGDIREDTIEEGLEQAQEAVAQLRRLGWDLNLIGQNLQEQGVRLFCNAFEDLMKTLEEARQINSRGVSVAKSKIELPNYQFSIPSKDQTLIQTALKSAVQSKVVDRFLKEDPSIWKTESQHQRVIQNRLGWLTIHEKMLGKLYEIESLQKEVSNEKFQDIVLLGMGGSSLAPEVMSLILRKSAAKPRFCIVDTTDPQSIKTLEKKLTLKRTLFIVSSKSGGTIETLSQFEFFYEQVAKAYGKKGKASDIGKHFIAITDPGSQLEVTARDRKFRKCFINPANIGGRYSALSLFGMVPAALMGLNVSTLLAQAKAVFDRIQKTGDIKTKPEAYLGILLGAYAAQSRDKMTFVTTKTLQSFGSWVEQLVAESTGKEKQGVLPVDSEDLGDITQYGDDRIFIVFQLKKEASQPVWKQKIQKLIKAGFPVIQITWQNPENLAAEFLSWEIATAFCGTVSKINPFDEPNVTESKEITGRLLSEMKQGKSIENPTRYFYAKKMVELGLILKQLRKGSYLSLLSYTPRTPQIQAAFSKLRKQLRKAFRVPVLLGFGPRYLHSIGQFYKGGTPSGLFMEFVIQDKTDLKVPKTHYSFSQLKRAQALGDFEAIQNKGLPIIMIDLGTDAVVGLRQVDAQLKAYFKKNKTF